MSGPPDRIAVQVGTRTVRIAGAVSDGEPWLIAERSSAGVPDLAELLHELVGPAPAELVVVHPVSWSAQRVAAGAAELAGLAGAVHAVPVPLAAAATLPVIVLDVGHAGTEVTRLAADGSVCSCRTGALGGAQLDQTLLDWLRAGPGGSAVDATRESSSAGGDSALAEARRVRERLSLLPTADTPLAGSGRDGRIRAPDLVAVLTAPLRAALDLLDEVRGQATEPVLLIGGVARTPLLAELLDAAGVADVVVMEQPEAAAVLGALRRLPGAAADSCGRDPPVGRPGPGQPGPGQPGPGQPGAAPARSDAWPEYFPPPRRRPLRAALRTLAASALAALLLGLGIAVFPPSEALAPPAGVVVQYGYRVEVPAGWEHTGGLPQRRRVLLTPAATPAGTEVIAVERTPLGYDSAAERARALAELRAAFDAAVAGGSALSGYRTGRHAGRDVVRYEQRDAGGHSAVDWFVVWDGDTQFSVGCRHVPTGVDAVRAACARVVGSVRRT